MAPYSAELRASSSIELPVVGRRLNATPRPAWCRATPALREDLGCGPIPPHATAQLQPDPPGRPRQGERAARVCHDWLFCRCLANFQWRGEGLGEGRSLVLERIDLLIRGFRGIRTVHTCLLGPALLRGCADAELWLRVRVGAGGGKPCALATESASTY